MRLAVLADIHGNVAALEAVRDDLARRNIDRIVNLGDCVSGPLWPRETLDLLMRLDWPTVRGNHDRWVTDQSPGTHYPSDAFAYGALDAAGLAWLGALPATLALDHAIFACHGRPADDNAYLLEDVEAARLVRAKADRIAERLAGVTDPIVLCAHSHLPGAVRLADARLVLNPGSAGCPAYEDPTPPAHVSESGVPHAMYAVLAIDGASVSFEHIAVSYDHATAARRAESIGRPDWAHALATGWAGQGSEVRDQ